jgi:hypothetical protein
MRGVNGGRWLAELCMASLKGIVMSWQDIKEETNEERIERLCAQRQDRERRRHEEFGRHDDCVLTFVQWCDLNGISKATGRRIIKEGKGPAIVRLSSKRIGITIRSNRDWQAARAR